MLGKHRECEALVKQQKYDEKPIRVTQESDILNTDRDLYKKGEGTIGSKGLPRTYAKFAVDTQQKSRYSSAISVQ